MKLKPESAAIVRALLLVPALAALCACADDTAMPAAEVARLDKDYGQLEFACNLKYPPHIGVFLQRAHCHDKMMYLWARQTERDTTLTREVNAKRDDLARLIDSGGIPPNDATQVFKRFEDTLDKVVRDTHGDSTAVDDTTLRVMLGAKGLPSGGF